MHTSDFYNIRVLKCSITALICSAIPFLFISDSAHSTYIAQVETFRLLVQYAYLSPFRQLMQ